MRSLHGFLNTNVIQAAKFALILLTFQGLAPAATISRTGVFSTDDQLFQYQFSLSSVSTVTLQSFGYGGGTNGLGTAIPQGGFATDVALFSAAGSKNLINEDSTGGSAPVGCGVRRIDSSSGLCLDGYFQLLNLPVGSYIVTLTEQGNPANGPTFGDGFAQTGRGNFTNGPFVDPFQNQRNGSYALDISAAGVVTSSTPEPGTVVLTLLFAPGIVLAARRRSFFVRTTVR